MQLLMTPEGKKITVRTDSDHCLYNAPYNPPNTGTNYTAGTDLYHHRARSGNEYYYTRSWSMWQGSEDSYELITEDAAKAFILERACRAGYVGQGVKQEACEEHWGEDFFNEDA
jgi:hypothetical protein